MAYDEELAKRIRGVLSSGREVKERKMFGGLAFMVSGNMACGIVGDRLMVRISPEGHAAALKEPQVAPMDFTGKPMRGFVYVAPPAIANEADLARWVGRGVQYASSLPPK